MLLSLMILLFVWTAASTGCRAGRAESQYWWGRASKEEPELYLSIRKKGIRGREQDQRGQEEFLVSPDCLTLQSVHLWERSRAPEPSESSQPAKCFVQMFLLPPPALASNMETLCFSPRPHPLTPHSSIAITQVTLGKDYFLFFPNLFHFL